MPQFNTNAFLPVQSRFVQSKEEALSLPAPPFGCLFCFHQSEMIMYAKYADGRDMEEYSLVKKEPPAPPQYLTEEDVTIILDKRFDEIKDLIEKMSVDKSDPVTDPGADVKEYKPKYKKKWKEGRNYE